MDRIIKIPWKVGRGNIVLDVKGETIRVSSDSSAGANARSQVITFQAENYASASLEVYQRGTSDRGDYNARSFNISFRIK